MAETAERSTAGAGIRVSVCILAKNEAGKLEHALASVAERPWCDEIVVFDSGSTDDTVQIAQRFTERVERREWVNFSENRQQIVQAAKNDWVFILDADEAVSDTLAEEIGRLDSAALADTAIFTMPRKNFMFGRHVRAWDPDRIDRLFNRTRVRWLDRLVHDTRRPTQGGVRKLSGPILHRQRLDDWADFFDGTRDEKRADALAREALTQGKRARRIDMWFRPGLTYLKFYVVKKSFLQGTFGMLIARKAAVAVHLKYSRMWYLQGSMGVGQAEMKAEVHSRDAA